MKTENGNELESYAQHSLIRRIVRDRGEGICFHSLAANSGYSGLILCCPTELTSQPILSLLHVTYRLRYSDVERVYSMCQSFPRVCHYDSDEARRFFRLGSRVVGEGVSDNIRSRVQQRCVGPPRHSDGEGTSHGHIHCPKLCRFHQYYEQYGECGSRAGAGGGRERRGRR